MEFCSRLVIICAICWATFFYRLWWRWRHGAGAQFLRGKSTKKSFVYWKMRNGLQQFRNARLFPFQAISPSVCSPTFYPISSSVFKYLQSYCPLEPDMNFDGYNSYSWCTLHIHETSICTMMCTGENDASHVDEWGANCRPLGITVHEKLIAIFICVWIQNNSLALSYGKRKSKLISKFIKKIIIGSYFIRLSFKIRAKKLRINHKI